METTSGAELSKREYTSLCKEYRVKTAQVHGRSTPPVHYAEIRGRESGEVLAYLHMDMAREMWSIHAPDSVAEEMLEAFG